MSCTRVVSMMRRLLPFTMVAIAASAGLVIAQVRHASATPAMTQSYELVGADGGVFTGAGATYSGSLGGRHIAHPIVAVLGASANDTIGPGYLLVDSAGIVYPFGLKSLGDLRRVHLNAPIVAAVAVSGLAPYRGGYVMVAADGGVFAFGGARFPGSLAPFHLRVPIVGIQAAFLPGVGGALPDGRVGYRLVDAAGHVYTLGGAKFDGDLGATRLEAPVVGIDGGSGGYWLATGDGKVYAFGSASWRGDASRLRLHAPIVGIAAVGDSYYLFAADGGVFAYGSARFLGSTGGRRLSAPITAMAMQFNVAPCHGPLGTC